MRRRSGTAGVDWAQAQVGEALLVSPLFGFSAAALLLLLLKAILPYRSSTGAEPG